jgi:hypothetical protein
MANDDDSPSRAELERVAYGRADSDEQRAAAQDALRRLVERDAAAAQSPSTPIPPVLPVLPVEPTPPENDVASVEPDATSTNQPPRARRSLLPLAIVIALFVGAVGGVLLAHTRAGSVSAASADATGSTPTPAPTADAGAALKSLLLPQSKADKGFPLQSVSSTLNIQPASIHRILTAADGATLWTGRTDTDICLMWTAPPTHQGDSADGGVGCATPTAFANGGLTISEGLVSWTWNGRSFSTSIAD